MNQKLAFKKSEILIRSSKEKMAGVAGFEPTNDGIKTRCLTAWRHPCRIGL